MNGANHAASAKGVVRDSCASAAPVNVSVGRRLRRALGIQAAVIGVVCVIGVLAAAFTIENVLITRALEDEADYYWKLVASDPSTAAPNTQNLTGYLARRGDDSEMPPELRILGAGHHDLPTTADVKLAYVTVRGDKRLVLVFEGTKVRELSFIFGLAPLGLVLCVVYLSAWWSYRATRRAVSPVEWLARQVNALDPERPDPQKFKLDGMAGGPDREVLDLANALAGLTGRVNGLVDRERNFTRDASHELRSPLTVIRMAATLLLADSALDEKSKLSVERIQRAAKDMGELVEAFLLLARESELGLEFEPVCVNDAIAEEIERARMLAQHRDVDVCVVEDSRLLVQSTDKVVSTIIGNLIRNAVDYTEAGAVVVRIAPCSVEICDSGPGMEGHEVEQVFDAFYRGRAQGRGHNTGHGVGLTIVKRLSVRFGWPVTFDSTPGQGTCVTIRFPDAMITT